MVQNLSLFFLLEDVSMSCKSLRKIHTVFWFEKLSWHLKIWKKKLVIILQKKNPFRIFSNCQPFFIDLLENMSTENEYLFYKITKSKLWYSFKQSYVKNQFLPMIYYMMISVPLEAAVPVDFCFHIFIW